VKKQTEQILRNEKIFIGLEDSKKTWKLCVRSGDMVVAETTMPAQYEALRNYHSRKEST
jgi:transposase